MKLDLLVPQYNLTEYEWRTRQAHRLELAIAQAPDKATKRALENQRKRVLAKIEAAK